MKLDLAVVTSLLLTSVSANAVPQQERRHVVRVDGEPQQAPSVEDSTFDLWKRRGGGGGGGRGGGGGGGGSRGGSSGGGSRGGSGGSPPSNSRFPNTKSGSTTGGYSARGSGPQPRFLGGTVYGGGAKVPYAAGKATPSGVRARGPLSGPALAFWPAGALFLGGAYMYGPYGYHYRYHNETSDEDEDREIICGCAEDSVCMCDEIEDDDFWEELIGDGDYDKLNKTLVDVSEVNGTTTILVNGTLPKGTTVESGDEDDYAEYLTNAANTALQTLGLWPAIGAVAGVVMMV